MTWLSKELCTWENSSFCRIKYTTYKGIHNVLQTKQNRAQQTELISFDFDFFITKFFIILLMQEIN